MPARPYDPWHDADGPPIPPQCRIAQIAVDNQRGATPSRRHQHDQILGRTTHRLTVRFDDDTTTVRIRPHLVRMITTPGGR